MNDEEPSLAEVWVSRGDLTSAHYCLNYSLDVLVRLLFALNHEFLPPPKWRLYYSYRLKWLPRNYIKFLSEAMVMNGLSQPELERRLAAVRSLWHDIVAKLEQCMDLKSIETYYVTRILGIDYLDFILSYEFSEERGFYNIISQ